MKKFKSLTLDTAKFRALDDVRIRIMNDWQKTQHQGSWRRPWKVDAPTCETDRVSG
jgi:hypothetical protein